MNIIYLANIRFPTERAHGIQIAKMCSAFADIVPVTLCVSDRDTEKENPYEYYAVQRNFVIKKIRAIDTVSKGSFGFFFFTLSFFVSFLFSSPFDKGSVIYVRDPFLAFFLSFTSLTYFFEVHEPYSSWYVSRGVRRSAGIIAISSGLVDYFKKSFSIDDKKTFLAHDAVEESRFEKPKKNNGNIKVDIPSEKKIVLYSGHLYSWKGVDTLAEAASFISDPDIHIVFLGGTDEDTARFRDAYGDVENISILGRRPYSEMPYYKEIADVLVIPNTSEHNLSKSYSSPMKLFSSMASGKPIVASRVESLTSVIDESMATFFDPDNPESLAEAVELVFDNYDEALEKAKKAKKEAWEKYTWKKRAKNILSFINFRK